ncbi:MAG: glycosyltransferase family 4 protein [Pseudomonadota bacterium]|nr:glycosyltransferase family 4 protein [Pseudomonadota bacterium]
MRVLQVLPALNSGGVERGTVEFARELVKQGHESIVLSSGGRLVDQLEAEGSRHVTMPVHRKSLASFGQILPVRQLLKQLKPDVVHVRSRLPAWIIWLAWRGLPEKDRPALVSTFHGMYSVNAYSAIMAKPQHLIAISHCVERYILDNYKVAPERITVIQRGVDTRAFHPAPPDAAWLEQLYSEHPQLEDKKLILMPGRLTRWKGQEAFLAMMADLLQREPQAHGVVVGGAEKNKESYLAELKAQARKLGIDQQITFTGHRSDIVEFYRLADVVCHMSNKPEPFGRTLTEALAVGTPVVAFDRGGAAESLSACFPEGLVPPDDLTTFAARVHEQLHQHPRIVVHPEFQLEHQVQATLEVYHRAVTHSRRP